MSRVDRYVELNLQFLRHLQANDIVAASATCDQLNELVPDHPNVMEFRRIVVEHSEELQRRKASGEAQAGKEEESSAEESGDSGDDDDDEEEEEERQSAVAAQPSASRAVNPSHHVATAAGAELDGGDEKLSAAELAEIDKIFESGAEEAAAQLERMGILQRPSHRK